MRIFKIIVFVMLLGITSSCKNTLVDPDVVEIAIENRETGLKHIVTDKDSIEKIVSIINSSKNEFCIFNAQKEMTLKYNNKKDISIKINSDGHFLRIDGKPYVTNRGLKF